MIAPIQFYKVSAITYDLQEVMETIAWHVDHDRYRRSTSWYSRDVPITDHRAPGEAWKKGRNSSALS